MNPWKFCHWNSIGSPSIRSKIEFPHTISFYHPMLQLVLVRCLPSTAPIKIRTVQFCHTSRDDALNGRSTIRWFPSVLWTEMMVPQLCWTCLRTMNPWLRWLTKAGVPQWDICQGPTELLWSGCLTRSIWTQKIQILYIDTKHQLADMLTKGNFTRDERNTLLHLFNVGHFSSTWCSKNCSLISCSTMAKRIQEQNEEERVVSKL